MSDEDKITVAEVHHTTDEQEKEEEEDQFSEPWSPVPSPEAAKTPKEGKGVNEEELRRVLETMNVDGPTATPGSLAGTTIPTEKNWASQRGGYLGRLTYLKNQILEAGSDERALRKIRLGAESTFNNAKQGHFQVLATLQPKKVEANMVAFTQIEFKSKKIVHRTKKQRNLPQNLQRRKKRNHLARKKVRQMKRRRSLL